MDFEYPFHLYLPSGQYFGPCAIIYFLQVLSSILKQSDPAFLGFSDFTSNSDNLSKDRLCLIQQFCLEISF